MRKFSLLLSALLLAAPALAQKKAAPEGGRLTLYLEAMDGQGWQWFFLADTVRRNLPASELRVYPLVQKEGDGAFSSRRGEAELAEATRLAVLAESYQSRMLSYLNARSLSPSADGWMDAALFAGINPEELDKKAAAEGQAALRKAYAKSEAAGAEATTLFLDGKRYEGYQRLMPLYEAVNKALPSGKRVPPPAGYVAKPKPVPPGFWVVLSSGMETNSQLVAVFDRYFEGIKAQELDYGSKERSARFPDLLFAPSYVLAATPEAKKRLANEVAAGLFKEQGGYLVYEDRQRRGLYAGRPEKKNTVELFVMSQCPFGVMAEDALLAAEKNGLLPAGVKLEVHFIGDAKKDDKGAWQFSSLHGQAEWEENARQAYIAAKFPEKFKAYLSERNKDVHAADWQKAAKAAGIDAGKVEKGFDEAKELLAADFAVTSKLGISTSPSFIVDGRQFMVGLGELTKVPGFEKIPPPGQPAAGCEAK